MEPLKAKLDRTRLLILCGAPEHRNHREIGWIEQQEADGYVVRVARLDDRWVEVKGQDLWHVPERAQRFQDKGWSDPWRPRPRESQGWAPTLPTTVECPNLRCQRRQVLDPAELRTGVVSP